MNNYLLVFIGGGLGSSFRYFIGNFMNRNVKLSLPWNTLSANLIACVILGILTGWLTTKLETDSSQRLFIGVGICGGLSTFSTFTLEIFELVKSNQIALAISYMLLSTISCLLLFWLMWSLGKNISLQ
jgi:fluoride exporter